MWLLMKQKVLILSGQDVHCKVVETANELGLYTIVTDYLENSPAKKIANETSMVSILDVDGIYKLAKEKHVDAVINICNELAVPVLQEVNSRLNFPNIGTKEQIDIFTDKMKFKMFCMENDVDVIMNYNENDDIEYPVVVKPIDSRGSRGVSICTNKEELEKAICLAKKQSKKNSIIIEKYFGECQDLNIVYIVKNGVPYLISIGDRYRGSEVDGLECQIRGIIQPSRYAKMYIDNVNNKVINMLKQLKIENAAIFMQGFVDGNTVRMYDQGIRFPGNEYERIFFLATGMNPVKSMIMYFLTGEMGDCKENYEGSYDLNGLCAIQYMINARKGKICVFDGLNEIKTHKNVVHVSQKKYVGDLIDSEGDVGHRVGEISILCKRSDEEIKDVINFIQSKLDIRDEKNKNMIISPLDICVLNNYKNII